MFKGKQCLAGSAIAFAAILVWLTPVHPQISSAISGRVFDMETGVALPGANVIVRDSQFGSSTDSQGNFVIRNVPPGNYTLAASYIGYKKITQKITVSIGEDTEVVFALQADVLAGEELVVVGYATQQLRDVTGSVTTVRSDELNTVAATSVNQILKGKAAGLVSGQRSAQPGGGVNVNIRGSLSPLGANSPLYVIDGVPITNYDSAIPSLNDRALRYYGGVDQDPLSYLNPSDIESVTVLKDASSTAIYGSAAANGVVFINTKDGGVGKLQVKYRSNYSIQSPHAYMPMLSANQFMREQTRLSHERYLWQNNLPPYGNADSASIAAFVPFFSESEVNAGVSGTDWFDKIMQTGHINEHSLSISGGVKHTRVYTSFNYQDNDAVLRNSRFKRYAARVNLDHDFGDKVSFRFKSTVSRLTGNNVSTGANAGGAEKFNMIQAAASYAPTVGVFDENGDYQFSYNRIVMNPVAFLSITDDGRTDHIFAAPNLGVKLSENLKLNLVGQADLAASSRNFYLPTTANHSQVKNGMAQIGNNQIENYTTEAYLTYEKKFENSSLTAVTGAGYYESQTIGSSLTAQDFFTDAFGSSNVGVAGEPLLTTIASFRSERKKVSQFMRVNYELNDKYLFSLVGRRDGSSIFAENKKYGIFPGISVAWRISEEDFAQSMEAISDLKLRFGYGQSGNESVLTGNSLQLYNPGYPALVGGVKYNGVALSQVANPNLTWETSSSVNIGLDFSVFNRRIRGTMEYFQRTARDLLDFTPLPANNAVGLAADNVGSTRSRGMEISLNTLNLSRGSFTWISSFNFSAARSSWVERNPQTPLAPWIGEQDAIFSIYGFETDGIIRRSDDIPAHMPNAFPGNIIYVDQNQDGVLNGDDVVKIGDWEPDWTFGLNNSIAFGKFDLNISLYGWVGFSRYNNFVPNADNISQPVNPGNTTILAEEIWSSDNPNGSLPGIAANPYAGNNPASADDFYLEEASFLRLQTISMGYRLPNTTIRRIWPAVRLARFFFNMDNLAVLTNYSGYDPEYTENNPYPHAYATTFGVEIEF